MGHCGVITNQQGTLHSLVAGYPVVLHTDPIERKPFYHVRPNTTLLSLGTLGCNMTCNFCQNWRVSQAHPDLQALGEAVAPEAIIQHVYAQGSAGIAFTYNEPTIYLDYAIVIMRLAKQAGLITAFKSNGYLTPEAIDLIAGGNGTPLLLDAANIDVKGFNDRAYRRICGARLQPVLDAVAFLHQCGVWVEVTTLLIPGVNDSDEELGALATWLAAISPDIPWHLWRFHPDYRMTSIPWTHVRDLDRAVTIGRNAGLRYIYTSNTPGDPNQHTRCPNCAAMLIERHGNATVEVRLADGRCWACGCEIVGRW